MIRAFKHVVSTQSINYRLVIAGPVAEPPYHRSLELLLRQEGIVDRVTFWGELPYSAMPGLYRSAELFVLPSLVETFGHPLVEAMASGLPVITTDLPASREICGDAALYFRPGDEAELVDKIHLVLKDTETRDAPRAAGLGRALVRIPGKLSTDSGEVVH
ncbi:MAG: glycosyltransferase [Acidobacteria bacterium]|nr:glycosyltransferase [Acidobacteriota bacterium]